MRAAPHLAARLPRVDDDPAVQQAEATYAEVSRQFSVPTQRLRTVTEQLAGMRRSDPRYRDLVTERADLEQGQPARDRYLAEARDTRDAARADAALRLGQSTRDDQLVHLARIAQGIAELVVGVSAYDAWRHEQAARGVDRGFIEVPIPRHLGRPDDASSVVVHILTAFAEAGVETPSPLLLAARVTAIRDALAARPAA